MLLQMTGSYSPVTVRCLLCCLVGHFSSVLQTLPQSPSSTLGSGRALDMTLWGTVSRLGSGELVLGPASSLGCSHTRGASWTVGMGLLSAALAVLCSCGLRLLLHAPAAPLVLALCSLGDTGSSFPVSGMSHEPKSPSIGMLSTATRTTATVNPLTPSPLNGALVPTGSPATSSTLSAQAAPSSSFAAALRKLAKQAEEPRGKRHQATSSWDAPYPPTKCISLAGMATGDNCAACVSSHPTLHPGRTSLDAAVIITLAPDPRPTPCFAMPSSLPASAHLCPP